MINDWFGSMDAVDWGFVGILAIGFLIAIIRTLLDIRKRRKFYEKIKSKQNRGE